MHATSRFIAVRPMRAFGALALGILATCGLGPTVAMAAGPWSLELSAGVASDYTYRSKPGPGGFEEHLGPALLAQASVGRHAGPWLSLHADLGYVEYDAPLRLASIPEVPPSEGERRSQVIPVGLGFRVEPGRAGGPEIQPFFQVSAAMFFTHWAERIKTPAYDDYETGERVPASLEEDSFWHATPGFIASAGTRARLDEDVHLHLACRYLVSGEIAARDLGRFSGGAFDGLNQFAVTAGLTLTP